MIFYNIVILVLKFKKKIFLRCIAVSVFRLKKIFLEVFRCFVSLFRGLEMPITAS